VDGARLVKLEIAADGVCIELLLEAIKPLDDIGLLYET
jgi:hypothetical protein